MHQDAGVGSRVQPREIRRAPLSFRQERFRLLEQITPSGGAYNLAVALSIQGPLNVAALQQALSEIVRRHEVLRTAFAIDDLRGAQIVFEPAPLDFPVFDLGLLTPGARAKECERICNEETQRPFNLYTPPLFRGILIRNSADDHVLVITVHHAVCDGWSRSKILPFELNALYGAFSQGAPSPLPPLPLQYADYALREREHLQGAALEERLQYWRQCLHGCSHLDFPADRTRPAHRSFRGQVHSFLFIDGLLKRIENLCRAEGVTVFMALLAALNVVLARWAGQNDIVVGCPVAGRSHKDTLGMIGMFVNMLPIRLDLSGDPSFSTLLRRLRKVALSAYAHQDVPLEQVAAELPLQRDLSRQPLFEVTFNWHVTDRHTFELPGLTVAPVKFERAWAPFDLCWHVLEQDGNLRGFVEYATDLFDASTIERLVQGYHQVLQAVGEDAAVPISQLPLMSEADRHQQLVTWNATQTDYPTDRCVHELFAEQVARTPNAPALVCGDVRLTYRELDERASQLAHHLVQLGVEVERVVGVCQGRSIEQVVSVLGVLKAGAAYLPLDPAHPGERLTDMLQDADTRIVLVDGGAYSATLSALPASVQVVDVRALASELGRLPTGAPHTKCDSGNLAYLIYTSGSTGRAKGVAAIHRSVVNRVHAQQRIASLKPGDVCCQKTAVGFVDAVFELFGALLNGCKLVIADEVTGRDAQQLLRLLRANQVKHLVSVPSLAHALASTGEAETLTELQHWTLSGEALSGDLLKELQQQLPWCEFANVYGCSEVGADASVHLCGQQDASQEWVSIGGPLPNAQVYVLDELLQAVPVGAVGELYVGGAGIARGYLGRADLTAERFVADPFSAKPGARLYRTGDRARYLADGKLQYLGRADHQVKIRGYRIELGEIESKLRAHPQVDDAVVMAREDRGSEKRLVAYVTRDGNSAGGERSEVQPFFEAVSPAPSAASAASDLRDYLRSKLPEYMIPAQFVFLPSLPLNASGKVDRRSLPEPDAPAHPEAQYVAPTTPTEEVLAQIWAEVLQVDQVGVEDNFFELGGHSLLGTQVMARVREQLEVELPLRVLFETTGNVRELASQIETARREQQGVQLSPLTSRGEYAGELPLSFSQERLWFLEQLESLGGTYNESLALRVQGELNVEALQKSFQELVRRHESLRTCIRSTAEGKGVQYVRPAGDFNLRLHSVEEVEPQQRERQARRLAHEELKRPIDLGASVFRAFLLKVTPHEHLLLITIHHIMSDVWSLFGVLRHELSVLYAAHLKGEPSPLAPLEVQYADYALWQRQWLQGEVLGKQLSYWREKLSGIPAALELPTDHPRPPVPSYRGALLEFAVPAKELQALRALARREGVTLYMVLLAALQAVLARWSNQQDVAIGSPIAGRTHRLTEGLIGFFVNTLVMRTDLSGDPEFGELLQRVRETALGAYAHQEMPIEKLVMELQSQRDLSRQALFQVMFTLHNMQLQPLELPGLTVLPLPTEHTSAKFDLSLDFFERETGLWGRLEYAADLFDASTVERLTQSYQQVLRAVGENAAVPISQLPLMSDVDRYRQVVEWNATHADYPTDRCVHELFAEQVARTPDAPALVCGETQLTYRELDERANRLAQYLVQLEVEAEQVVGVCQGRSVEQVVSVLGVMKAGAAYLPLDPTHPGERLSDMLQDAGTRIVLVDGEAHSDALSALPAIVQVVDLRALASELSRLPTDAPRAKCASNTLAYVIYTSGSTGRAKGVAAIHRSIVNRVYAQQRIAPLKPGDMCCQKTAVGFVDAVFELFGALLSGCKLVIADEDTGRDPQQLLRLLRANQVKHLVSVPSLARALVSTGEAGTLTDLRHWTLSGEPLRGDLLRDLQQQLPWCEFANVYGSSEVGADAAVRLCDQRDATQEWVSIGVPLPNAQVYVLDEQLQVVPEGVVGELFIGGDGVARGYLGRANLTAERFVADPFGARPGARLYRTGDRVRYLQGGKLQYLGRADHQVKLRGHRIELGEIQSKLRAHPQVQDAVVIARDDDRGEKRLVAYVAHSGEIPEPNELREHLRSKLPEYMMPAQLVFLQNLPLNASGKVDRRALPDPNAVPRLEAQYVAPATPTEATLSQIWAEALGLERVSVHDNFFDIGGHSLMLLRVHREIVSRMNLGIAVVDLFRYPTIQLLCDHFAAGRAVRDDADPDDNIALRKTYFRRAGHQHG